MGNFFLFKYTLRGYAAKLERKNLNYALMAHVIREGGFKVGQSLFEACFSFACAETDHRLLSELQL